LPFSITLNDFIADKYPGTEKNYSAFKSKVTVNKSDSDFYDYEIFMNHILDEQGYRFFQSSFDGDEKGTILSVNHDFWGTWITYIGYTLLYLAMLAILFDKNTRFASLRKMLEKIKKKKGVITTTLILFISFSSFSQNTTNHKIKISKEKIDSIIVANSVSKEHAANFATLVVQDNGRMKPINTFASELLRKISRKNSYAGLDANQVFLSMTEFPSLWLEAPIMSLKWQNDSIREILEVKDAKHFSLMDLIDNNGNNKLGPYIEEASKTINKNQFQKDFMKAYENFYLLNEALGGSILKIFPIPEDENNRWVSYPELDNVNYNKQDSVVVRTILPYYFETLRESRKTGDYTNADVILSGLLKFQNQYGNKVMPSQNKITAEIWYNKIDIFNKLYKYFAVFGILMFVFIIVQIFRENKIIDSTVKLFKYIIWILFILLTLGLIARWYISGHAPWSDAYESIIYVAWATVFFWSSIG